MLRIERILKYIGQESPHDYETYNHILNHFEYPKYVRKLKAGKYAVKKFIRLKWNERQRRYCHQESQIFSRKDNRQYIKMLMKYDVISFDVFDTLILRKICDSSDVFYLVGKKLGINGFRNIRILAEQEARRRRSLEDTDDVSLKDIYTVLHEWCDVNIDEGMTSELEAENALCTANPYWYPVFKELVENGKTVIITTDMYLSGRDIENILQRNQYVGEKRIYVSSEIHASKRNGRLYDVIQNDLGNSLRYIHIGDHPISDQQMAEKRGWDVVYYKNVHEIGKKYRYRSKSILADSVAGGILDVRLHNGILKYDALQELGFACYGALHVGYCQWLERFAREKKIDKFLFVSRDCYLLQKIYSRFFGHIPGEYVYVSRHALSQVTILEDMEMFLQQNIEPRTSGKQLSLGAVLEDMGLHGIKNRLGQAGLSESDILRRENYGDVRNFFYENRQQIAGLYKDARSAARQYFTKLTEGYSNIAVVDIGWLGTCTRGISVFLHKNLKWPGKVYGAQIGIECSEKNIEMYSQDELCSYAFSPDQNSHLYKKHGFGIGNIVDEIVFSAPEPSLLCYQLDENGKFSFDFLDEPIENIEIVNRVHKGVWEYAEEYCGLQQKLGMELIISAEYAYRPILDLYKNNRYLNSLLGTYSTQRNAATMRGENNCLHEYLNGK